MSWKYALGTEPAVCNIIYSTTLGLELEGRVKTQPRPHGNIHYCHNLTIELACTTHTVIVTPSYRAEFNNPINS